MAARHVAVLFFEVVALLVEDLHLLVRLGLLQILALIFVLKVDVLLRLGALDVVLLSVVLRLVMNGLVPAEALTDLG